MRIFNFLDKIIPRLWVWIICVTILCAASNLALLLAHIGKLPWVSAMATVTLLLMLQGFVLLGGTIYAAIQQRKLLNKLPGRFDQ